MSSKYGTLILWFVALGLTCSTCHSQSRDVVCSNGYGKLETKFSTGVTVSVGAARTGELAKRACGAALHWDRQELLAVPEASQVDIDVLGADVGIGMPVVAFQVKKSEVDSGMEYQVYSLQKPPRLLRTITGGGNFRASDADLHGRIEVWTSDAIALDGFENLNLSEFDFPPTVVLQFENRRLLDVSSEFRSHFDSQISQVRTQLDSQRLNEFKSSDGKLPVMSPLPAEQLHRLRITKIKVLEIVWSYLYSGREQDAWRNLAEMWPTADFDRIRASLLSARARGMRTQVDDVSARTSVRLKRFAYVYETATDKEGHSADPATGILTADTKPQAILLRRPPPLNEQQALSTSEQMVDLVIDAAGKVQSAKAVGAADPSLLGASAEWKFIPAFKDGHAVASRYRLAVAFLR